MKKILFTLCALILIAAAGLALALNGSYKGFRTEQFVEFPKGTGTMEMARRLADAGVIPTRWHLLATRIARPNERWQAGEYRFQKAASAWEIADRLRRGDVYLVELRIPEGFNVYDISAAVEQAGLGSAQAFLNEARKPALIRDLAPRAPSLEGFLFPSTYHVPRKIGPEALCRLLTEQFRKEWKAAGGASANVLATVTLASLVEKETGAGDERPIVAGVYQNRLQKGMKLEADPTTIYAAILEGVWRGTIYKSDLQRAHPYNTYAVTGLPPGPIANPGRAALAAALRPATSEYLYFVAKGDGTRRHNFAKNYSDHQRNVIAWRRGRGT